MACGACYQTRQQFIQSARRFDIRGVASAAARGLAINVDKARGVDVEAKYGQQPTVKATPYKRPPDRST
jgi:hypothetical protein